MRSMTVKRRFGAPWAAEIMRLCLRRLLLPALLWLPSAASAQPAGSESYLAQAERQFTINARCPPQKEGEEIVVCGRRNETERYRLPIRSEGFDPNGPIDSVSRERHRLIQEGDAGIGSCSTTGPGGYTGCFHRDTKRRCEQKPCGMSF